MARRTMSTDNSEQPNHEKKSFLVRILESLCVSEKPPITPTATATTVSTRPLVKRLGRKKKETPVEAVKDIFDEFCDSSAIHGVKYLSGRPLREKVWWLVIFLVCLTLCGTQIGGMYQKWKDSPVLISFDETAVNQIPFPSITICPRTKTRRWVFNFTQVHLDLVNGSDNGVKEDWLQKYSILTQICQEELISEIAKPEWTAIRQNLSTVTFHQEAFFRHLDEMSLKFQEAFFQCQLTISLRFRRNCSELFTKTLTEEGVCYTFNQLDNADLFKENTMNQYRGHGKMVENWNPESGYSESDSDEVMDSYPVRAETFHDDLSVVLALNTSDFDYFCPGALQGFNVYLHSPTELPLFKAKHISVAPNQKVIMSVQPRMVQTIEILRSIPPDKRKCYFTDEVKLKHFKIYSQLNCELECLLRFFGSQCECVPFWMPRMKNATICGTGNFVDLENCLFFYKQRKERLGTTLKKFNPKDKCGCLPACNSIAYEAEHKRRSSKFKSLLTANAKYNNQKLQNGSLNLTNIEFSQIIVKFKHPQFFTFKRTELYGQTDFIASCGGLLGLFMGISLLSVVEIVYFCTIRFIWLLKGKKSTPAEETQC